ncbi:hypothetical protein D3C72_1810400 [compost metagenome]
MAGEETDALFLPAALGDVAGSDAGDEDMVVALTALSRRKRQPRGGDRVFDGPTPAVGTIQFQFVQRRRPAAV